VRVLLAVGAEHIGHRTPARQEQEKETEQSA